jgi:NAD(P)-dependent dehydrogenase (short-subunit alcohol dehydrogenase family)
VAHGAAVHICARRQVVLDEALAELGRDAKHGGAIESHICDVREPEQIEAMIDVIWQRGPLTGLVNNAAANFISPSIGTLYAEIAGMSRDDLVMAGGAEKLARAYPMRRIGMPEDTANAVLFFASPLSDWITGQILSVSSYTMV